MRIFVLLVLLLLAGGVGIFMWRGSQPIHVQVVRVGRDSIQVGYDEDGYIRSEIEAIVAARIAGRIRTIDARDGTPVRRGQTIATLDESDVRAAIDAADAEVARTRAVLDDTTSLVRTTVEAADAELAAAHASLSSAQAHRDEISSGPRDAERDRARALRSASQTAVWEARRQFERDQKLFKQGYVPQRQLDAAQSALRQAEARERQMDAEWRLVDEGSRSEQRRAADAQVSQAQAGVQTADARLHKARAAEPQIEAARAAVSAAEARARQVRAQLKDVVLIAPSSGSLVLQDVNPGDVVAPGAVVARIVDPTKIWVEAQVDERDVGGVKMGMPVRITTDTFPDKVFDGHLVRIQGEAVIKRRGVTSAGREEDRVFKTRVAVVDANHQLRPGMSVYVQIVTDTVKNTLVVPREAVMPQGAGWIAWIVENGRAVRHDVKLGARDVHRVQVTAGLNEGDQVVIGGRELLTEGCPVRVTQ